MIPRKTPLARGGRIAKKRRNPSEFARIYGSRERVEWVKSLPCACGCGGWPIDNAHTVTGGTSRKADADTIAPLAHACHVRYDRHLPPFDKESVRDAVKAVAARVEALWQLTRSAA